MVGTGAWFVQKHEARSIKREVLIHNAQLQRLNERQASWSSNALQWLAEAWEIKPEENLRSEVVASLAGLDVRLHFYTNKFGGRHLAWDSKGARLLIDRDPRPRTIAAKSGLPTRIP